MISNVTYLYLVIGSGVLAIVLAFWLAFRLNARISSFLTFVGAAALIFFTVVLWRPLQSSEHIRLQLASAEQSVASKTSELSDAEQRLIKAERDLAGEKEETARVTRKFDDQERRITLLKTQVEDAERERDRLKEQVAKAERVRDSLKTQVSEAERQRDSEIARREDLDRRLEISKKRVSDVEERLFVSERQLSEAMSSREELVRTHARRLDNLIQRARATRPSMGITTGSIDVPSAQSEPANERRVLVIERELDRLGVEEEIKTARIGVRDSNRDLTELRNRMSYGFSTDDYEVEVYPDNELINGQKGSYYTIDLKDAATGVKFGFEAGRYTLNKSDRQFRKALSAFMRDVVGKLDGNAEYRLMVRGSADAASYKGQFEPGYEYQWVAYLKQVESGKYVNELETRSIDNRVNNSDLPFLRARFLKDLVRDVYPAKEPYVLEGVVTRDIDKEDRNAELMLFVNW